MRLAVKITRFWTNVENKIIAEVSDAAVPRKQGLTWAQWLSEGRVSRTHGAVIRRERYLSGRAGRIWPRSDPELKELKSS